MIAVSLGDIWYWVWQTIWINSLSTTILVPIVLLICRIFACRPAVQNLLWLLLFVKFMTPQLPGFSWVIPESIVGAQWNQTSPLQQVQQEFVEKFEDTAWVSAEHVALPTHSTSEYAPKSDEEDSSNITALSESKFVLSPLQLLAATLSSIWFLGTGYFLVSICAGLRNQRWILKRTTKPGHRLASIVSEVAIQLGLKKLVPILSSDIKSPFISCLGSVRLVWPSRLTTSDPTLCRSLIAHEAAHVRRRDHYVAWLELIAMLVWWWNPLFWFVRRRLRVTAEMACDAMALETYPEDRCLYAEKLLELSTCFKNGTQPLALAVGGDSPSSIERRLTMIISDQGSSKTTLLGLLTVGMLAVVIVPSWSFAQNAENPPAPEPISWLLDPFIRGAAPPEKPIANQQAETTAPVLNNEEKLVLRLKAMYMIAISENRDTDAEALAAAILAMTQSKATEANSEIGGMRGAAPAEPVPVGQVTGMPGRGASGERGSLSGAVSGLGLPGGLSGTAGMLGGPGGAMRLDMDLWSTVYRHSNGSFDVPNVNYPKEIIRDHLALRVKVVGKRNGMVWGSNPYTDDSSLNAAAIHSGLVKDGETAELVFIRRPGNKSYRGSESHGVTTYDYGPYPGSFELASASQYPDAPYLCDRRALRGNKDAYLTLNMLSGQAPLKPGVSLIVPLKGKAGAPIVGTDNYASDCNLDAAAVHAGVLNLEEFELVKITLAEGLESYVGSKRNGVESFPYGKTKMSLRFERVPLADSGDPLGSPIPSGGAEPGLGETNDPTHFHGQENPPGAVPVGIGAPAGIVDPVGDMRGGGSPAFHVETEIKLDRQAYMRQDLGPRRNWQVERFNLLNEHSLGQLRPYQGLAVRVKATGKNDGPVWGSNAYTDDSSLNSAALHAGLVRAGETTEIVAIIRPGMKSYGGSEFHGITTNDFGPYPGSFQLVPVSQQPDAPYLCDRRALRDNAGDFLSLDMLAEQASLNPGVSLIVPLHGQSNGKVFGTDQYAPDCNLDAAAVHAGVLRSGESGFVKIVLSKGLESYSGSMRNGVESNSYGKTEMSIRFEKLKEVTANSDSGILPEIILQEGGLDAGSEEPIQIGFEDGK